MRILIIILGISAVIAIAGFLTFYFSTDNLKQFGAAPSGKRLERILQSPHYNGTEFVNQHGGGLNFTASSFMTMFKEYFFGKDRTPKIEIPVNKPTGDDFAESIDSSLVFTWMGHSTVLLEMDGMRILTDPVWSERSSPSSIYGPKRFHEIPIALDDLPHLDAVIISHDHYDHLDMKTVVKLSQTGTIFITTLGVGAHLEEWGIDSSQIIELDWWEGYPLSDQFKLVCTPAQHFSGRGGLSGRNKTFWSTWVITGPEHRVFFCGDTGEIPEFEEIGEKFGPFDLTLMKIGAYGDLWPDIHLRPEQAVRLHHKLRGEVFLPIHWGTFDLAMHDWKEPIIDLLKIAQNEDLTLVTPIPGQRINIDSLPPIHQWWLGEKV